MDSSAPVFFRFSDRGLIVLLASCMSVREQIKGVPNEAGQEPSYNADHDEVDAGR